MFRRHEYVLKNQWVQLFWPSVVLLFINLLFYNKYFPLTEGWWETYGYLVNQHKIMYRDFALAFPPLFVIYNALLLKFTHSFLVFRLIGVIVFSLNVLLLQLFLEKIYSRTTAAVASFFASFLLLSDVCFIAKDYHTYEITVTILTFLLAQCIVKTFAHPLKKNIRWFEFFILGFTCALLVFIKQNVGLFLSIAYLLSIVMVRTLSFREKTMGCCFYLIGIVFFAFLSTLVFHHYQVSWSVLYETLFHNNAKGNASVVLLRFMYDKDIRKMILYGIFSFLVMCFVYRHIYHKKNDPWIAKITNTLIVSVCSFTFLITYVLHKVNLLILTNIILDLSMLLFVMYHVYFYEKNRLRQDKYIFILVPLLFLVYCNTQTAGLNTTGMFLIVAFSTGYLISLLEEYSTISRGYIYGCFLIIIPALVGNKFNNLYNWWGLRQSSVMEAHYELSYPETKGIYVDYSTKKIFDIIHDSILQYSRADNDLYLFPHIPIFYFLHHKVPPYHNVIQWFDVITSQNLQEEFNEFKRNPPRLIIFLDPPNFVYQGHKALVRRHLVQSDFQNAFDQLVDQHDYHLKTYIIHQPVDHAQDELEYVSIVLKNKKFVRRTLQEIKQMFNTTGLLNNRYTLVSIVRDHLLLGHEMNDHMRMNMNDILIFHGSSRALRKLSHQLGYSLYSSDYVLKIYYKK